MPEVDWLSWLGGAAGAISLIISIYSAKLARIATDAARRSAELQEESLRSARRAQLFLDVGNTSARLVTNADRELVHVNAWVRNDGEHSAYDCSMGTFSHYDGKHSMSGSAMGTFNPLDSTMSTATSYNFKPGEIQQYDADVSLESMGPGTHRHITLRFHYRDRLGDHEALFKLMVIGDPADDYTRRTGFTLSPRQHTVDGDVLFDHYATYPDKNTLTSEFAIKNITE